MEMIWTVAAAAAAASVVDAFEFKIYISYIAAGKKVRLPNTLFVAHTHIVIIIHRIKIYAQKMYEFKHVRLYDKNVQRIRQICGR